MNADIVSVNGTNIYVFSDTTWLPITTIPLTLNGYTITYGLTVTWNSDNLLFYAVVNTTTGGFRLVTVDPSTGICIDKGNIGGPFGSLSYSGAANSLPGTLYAFGTLGNFLFNLYSVNINNGATTFLGGPYAGHKQGRPNLIN